ncbi:MAG: hypothetical protein U9R26_05945 [Campylobacterota bacterium]|nr:hypothetical protein [Campylobacterota bacterium]
MKQLEEENIDQLLDIINLYPSIRIMQISDGSHLLSKKISQLCEENEYEFQLNCNSDIFYQKSILKYADADHVKVKLINLEQPRYAIQAKMYDYLFVSSTIPDAQKSSFLKKTYGAIKNAGIIILFVSKGESAQHDLWTQLLEDNNFVATNILDIFSNYDLIISKKMHGWGG